VSILCAKVARCFAGVSTAELSNMPILRNSETKREKFLLPSAAALRPRLRQTGNLFENEQSAV
jgi:hypothetical protein